MEEKMDLRVQKTYRALHIAFDEILAEKRFEELTVNELCDRAMIRRTTFYKHFTDKYEYFSFYIREVMDTFRDRLAPDVEENAAGSYLLHMSRELLLFIREHGGLVQNIQNSSLAPLLLNILLEQFSADIVQVLQRADQHRDCSKKELQGLAYFYAGGLANTLFQFLTRDGYVDEKQFIHIASQFLMC